MSTIWALWEDVVASAICDFCCSDRDSFATVTVQMGMGNPCQGLYGGTGSRHYGREAGLFHCSSAYLPCHAHGPAFRVGSAVGFRGNRRMTVPIMDLDSWTLSQSIVVFSVCALVIAIAGTRITRVVDQLADRTGLGEATAGAVLLGA